MNAAHDSQDFYAVYTAASEILRAIDANERDQLISMMDESICIDMSGQTIHGIDEVRLMLHSAHADAHMMRHMMSNLRLVSQKENEIVSAYSVLITQITNDGGTISVCDYQDAYVRTHTQHLMLKQRTVSLIARFEAPVLFPPPSAVQA